MPDVRLGQIAQPTPKIPTHRDRLTVIVERMAGMVNNLGQIEQNLGIWQPAPEKASDPSGGPVNVDRAIELLEEYTDKAMRSTNNIYERV